MPRGDRTGPRGMGPMTGRGAGYCASFAAPEYMNPGAGRFVYGGGAGRGWRNQYYATGLPGWFRAGYAPGWQVSVAGALAPATPADEAGLLKQEAQVLKGRLDAIDRRLADIEEKK
ncbi:MAG: DUF5320 domain-containing protein [Chloroflexi bacterium]|nr:DUF5320 domain-containing protein [Chloroflexota bacterium]